MLKLPRSVPYGLVICGVLLQARAPDAAMTRQTIEAEMRARASRYLEQKQLVVDYYRIGRRLAFPLAFQKIPEPGLPVPGIPDYPWEIWLAWELEERINSLGWAAEWFDDRAARAAASRELEALTRWPEFTPGRRLDLCLGHTARILWQAYTQWDWLETSRKDEIGRSLDRLVAQSTPWIDGRYGATRQAREMLSSKEPQTLVHNIPFIGLIGVSLAANARNDEAAGPVNQRVEALLEVLTTLRRQGYSEAVAYDGYLLDFVADWIASLPPAARKDVLRRFDFSGFLRESCMLGAPRDITQVAEIGDVEPRHMPFHVSAQARLQKLQPDPLRAWYLSQCRPTILRADALACLRGFADSLPAEAKAPRGGIADAHYARVLRSGWGPGDLATAVSAGVSPAGHIHFDYGTITIGTAGRWIIADPGYQQYMPGEEREFTLGPAAHNVPVLNGKAQAFKSGKILDQREEGSDVLRLSLDMTACYPAEVGARRVMRTIWSMSNRLVAVADRIDAAGLETISYHWHGCPEAAWRVDSNWAMIHVEPATSLWLTSPSFTISDAAIERLPGSRGQLTLSVKRPAAPVIWWIFSLSDAPPAVDSDPSGRWIQVSGKRFRLE